MTDCPYMDFEDFGIAEGSRVSFVGLDGKLFTGIVKHLVYDKKTGLTDMTVE